MRYDNLRLRNKHFIIFPALLAIRHITHMIRYATAAQQEVQKVVVVVVVIVVVVAGPLRLTRRVHPLTVHTLLLNSPVGLDLNLARWALKDSLK